MIARKIQNERGASLVEYSLLIALIAVMGMASISQVGQAAQGTLSYAATQLAPTGDGPTNPTYYNADDDGGCTQGVSSCH